jgi:zinc transport system ATP-binding protein
LGVEPGEIVTLIGPNGSGKTTTAKIALGVLKPDEGSVSRRPGLRVAYVPQKVTIDWTLPLSVRRFLHLTGRVSKSEATEAMEATGLAMLSK